MKEFKCGDVVPGCEWVTRNDDEEELFAEISSHAREAHGMDEVPPEVVDRSSGDRRGLGPAGERAALEERLERLAYGARSMPCSRTHASL